MSKRLRSCSNGFVSSFSLNVDNIIPGYNFPILLFRGNRHEIFFSSSPPTGSLVSSSATDHRSKVMCLRFSEPRHELEDGDGASTVKFSKCLGFI